MKQCVGVVEVCGSRARNICLQINTSLPPSSPPSAIKPSILSNTRERLRQHRLYVWGLFFLFFFGDVRVFFDMSTFIVGKLVKLIRVVSIWFQYNFNMVVLSVSICVFVVCLFGVVVWCVCLVCLFGVFGVFVGCTLLMDLSESLSKGTIVL